MGEFTLLEIVGVLVQWASALVLLALFRQLARLGAQRRLLATWSSAWAALLLGLTGFLLPPLSAGLGWSLPNSLLFVAGHLYAPSKFVFLVMVALGALQAAGIAVAPRVEQLVGVSAAVVGGFLTLLLDAGRITQVQVVVTPLLFFASAALILRRVARPHRRAPRFLAFALAIYATLWSIYFLAVFFGRSLGTTAPWIDAIARGSGYGDALVATLLGAAVVACIVQASFIDLAAEREGRLADLAASEARLAGIIEAAEEAIITLDGEGRVDLGNSAAERMFGVRMAEMLGRSLDHFVVANETLPGRLATDSIESGASGPLEGPLTLRGDGVRNDGSEFPLEFSVGVLRGTARTGRVVILRDLTQRQLADAEREQFERRVADSEKMLAIGRLVSGVAHELNNPLAVVLGQSEQLLQEERGAETRSSLQLIYEQAHRARHIVKDLLAFVRQREKRRDPVDLCQLAQRLVAGYAAEEPATGIAVTLEVPEVMQRALADRLAIEQVVVNLLDNARAAAGPGGWVRLRCWDTGAMVFLAVEDSGPGVPPDAVGRIFEPFFTTKPVGQGTGLGLSVSLGIVEQHGGTLRLENRPAPGVGARFVLALPVVTADEREWTTTTPPSRLAIPGPASGLGGTATVLIVDDESSVRSTLSRLLHRSGWLVREAVSGEEGLAILLHVSDEELPALVLCDLKMPGIGGRELFARLRVDRPALLDRLIFVTGDVVEPATAAFIAESGCEVVEKPYTVAELAHAMARVLHR